MYCIGSVNIEQSAGESVHLLHPCHTFHYLPYTAQSPALAVRHVFQLHLAPHHRHVAARAGSRVRVPEPAQGCRGAAGEEAQGEVPDYQR